MKYLPSNGGQGDYQPPQSQLMDTSQARAMMALQAAQMQVQMQEQQMAMEMAAMQQRMQMEAQYQQQMYDMQQRQQQQMQQQYHAAHLDANDIRGVMSRLQPGESFEVEMYQGFEVRHTKQTNSALHIVIILGILLGVAIGAAML